MKIAVWHNLHSGGAKRALHQQIRGLVERGHVIEVWSPNERDLDFASLSEFAPEHIRPLGLTDGMTRLERLGVRAASKRVLARMDAHCRRCADEIDAGGFDLLFAGSCYHLALTSIGRYSSLPSVVYLQEPRRFLYEALPQLPWAAPPPLREAGWSMTALKRALQHRRDVRSGGIQMREEIRNARGFDHILCNSLFSRESILRAYGLDAEVCYLGVDADQFRYVDQPREDFILGLGAFARWKNPRLCIEAIAAIPAPRPPLVWVCNVEEPVHRAEMAAFALAQGVTLDIRLRIPDAELHDLLQRATAMIYTSRLEPFGLAPLEANACGAPVVATAEGGMRETVIDGVTGLLAGSTPASLAQAIQRLRDDPDLARRLGREGRRRVETFWSDQAATARLADKLEDAHARAVAARAA